jgi:hypothetical protein
MPALEPLTENNGGAENEVTGGGGATGNEDNSVQTTAAEHPQPNPTAERQFISRKNSQ